MKVLREKMFLLRVLNDEKYCYVETLLQRLMNILILMTKHVLASQTLRKTKNVAVVLKDTSGTRMTY